jgi:hypothetical protein
MPWNIIAIPVMLGLVWGVIKGLQTKIKSNKRFKRPFEMY